MKNEKKTSRRSILQAGAVAVGAALLPRAGAAAQASPALGTAAALEVLRRDYLGRVKAFAEELRPRFKAGELHCYRDSDPEMDMPMDRLEVLCRERFGLTVTERQVGNGFTYLDGDEPSAHVILAVSPMAKEITEISGASDSPCDSAAMAAAHDVLTVARERRWYQPTPDESYCYGRAEWPAEAA